MAKLSLNSISPAVFEYKSNGISAERDGIIAEGRTLFYEHARKGQKALYTASNRAGLVNASDALTDVQYRRLNKVFQEKHLLYAAKKACEADDMTPPETFEEFTKRGADFRKNKAFTRVLQGIYQQIVQPIIPAVYSEAVSVFADVVEVGFAETYAISVESNDIPIFQDSAWGAARSVPANRFYAKDYTLNPSPRTAEVRAKWHQLVGNNVDFGMFFANIVAGMYSKTMGMWSAMMTAAASDTTLIPSGLSYNFSSLNWTRCANKVSALNNTPMSNLVGVGGAVALAKVLPTQATGSANADMDAALAMLLGRDYIRNAQLGEFMKVRLMQVTDAVVPGTQNSNVVTMLPEDKVWIMASNRRKPLTIAYNSYTPIQIELEPEETNGAFEYVMNLTIALDAVSIFSSRVGLISI